MMNLIRQVNLLKALFKVVALLLFTFSTICGTAYASDTEFNYTYFAGDTGPNFPHPSVIDEDAGRFESVTFSYESTAEQLTVDITMRPPASNTNRFAKSFVLALSPQFQPHNNGSELAVFYFDGTRENPVLTAYSYEPSDAWDSGSWFTGDKLCTSLDLSSCNGWVDQLSMTNNADGSRRFYFSVDVSEINDHFPSTPNPQAAWKGAQFADQIGYWLTPYGYPNMSFFYNGNGYITLLNSGTAPGIEFQGFFDADNKETFRTPFCEESGPFSTTVDVGETFSTTISGTSPDNKPLTVNYSGVPAGATVTPVNGTTSNSGQITSTITWTPSAADIGTVAFIDASYSDMNGSALCGVSVIVADPLLAQPDCFGIPGGTAVFDQCDICGGDGTSCLGCDEVNITESQGDLDTAALTLLQIIRRSTRKAFNLAKGTDRERELRRLRRRVNRESRATYLEAWSTIQLLDSSIMVCTNLELCVQTSNVPILQSYNDDVDELLATAMSVQDMVAELGGRARRLRRRAVAARTDAQAAAGQIPAVESSCF